MALYSMSDGERIVKAARYAIELHLTSPSFNSKIVERYISDLDENAAVFVTLEHYPTNTPRGNSGSAAPLHPMHQAVVDAAVAATSDKRFVPVSHMEFEHLVVEVSILSSLERLTGKSKGAIERGFTVGRHGLHLTYGYHNATVLPETPVKNGWSSTEALDQLCITAGLSTHVWRTGSVKIYRFTTQRFRETTPRGPIEEITTE